MEKVSQLCPDGGQGAEPGSIAQTFIESLRAISAERLAEVTELLAERDSYRELAQAAVAELGELNIRLDRERASRLWLLTQYRALQSGRAVGDPRLDITDDAISEPVAA